MFSQDTKYAYISGRIGVLEEKLLKPEDIKRMIEAPNAQGAFSALEETAFSDNLVFVNDAANFGKVLEAEMIDVFNFFKKNLPDAFLLEAIMLFYNILNLKIIAKEVLCGSAGYQANLPVSSLDLEAFKKYFISKVDKQATGIKPASGFDFSINESTNIENLYQHIVDAVLDYYKMIGNTKFSGSVSKSFIIDSLFDQYYFSACRWFGAKIKSALLNKYFISQIDLHNIESFLRLKKGNGFSKEMAELIFVDGGSLQVNIFQDYINKNINEFILWVKAGSYGQRLESGLNEYLASGSFINLEKNINNYLFEILKQARQKTYGPELPFFYFFAKERDLQTVRVIMLGKMNEIEKEEIERLLN